jgi:hypothetical protein
MKATKEVVDEIIPAVVIGTITKIPRKAYKIAKKVIRGQQLGV